MNLTVDRKAFSRALSIVGKAVSARSTLPILHNVLIRAEEEGVILAGTQMEASIECRLPHLSFAELGEVTIPYKQLQEMVSLLDGEALEIGVSEDGMASVRSGRFKTQLLTLPAEEFPAIPRPGEGWQVRLPQEDLQRYLSAVLRFVSDDNTRPILTGVLLTYRDGELTLVATDTHRLIVWKVAAEGEGEGEAIVPGEALKDFVAFPPAEKGQEIVTTLSVDENQVALQSGSFMLSLRQIEGQYPKYERILIHEYDREALFPREAAVMAVRRCKSVAAADLNRVSFAFEEGKEIGVSAHAGSVGDVEDFLEGTFTGERLDVLVRDEYVLDCFAAVDSERVWMGHNAKSLPLVFRPEGQAHPTILLVPMQRQD